MPKARDPHEIYPRLILALLLSLTGISAHSSDFYSENEELSFVGSIVDKQGQGIAGARVNLRLYYYPKNTFSRTGINHRDVITTSDHSGCVDFRTDGLEIKLNRITKAGYTIEAIEDESVTTTKSPENKMTQPECPVKFVAHPVSSATNQTN